MEKKLTIFTPTYNRATFLPRVYQSLLQQTDQRFVWQIVDDGSQDDTEAVVGQFQQQGIIEIQYIKKENGGKHTAYNVGVKAAQTELFFVALDSDDWLHSNAVQKVLSLWEQAQPDTVGMTFLCENGKGSKLCNVFQEKELKSRNASLQEAFQNDWFLGEAEYVLRTEYAKQFLYPEMDGEKFFTEAYVYLQMTGKMLWSKESIYVREYQTNGLTDSVLSGFVKNPKSYALYNDLRLSLCRQKGLKRLKYALYYDVFCILAKEKRFLRKSSAPLLSVAVMPLAPFASLALVLLEKRRRRTKNE